MGKRNDATESADGTKVAESILPDLTALETPAPASAPASVSAPAPTEMDEEQALLAEFRAKRVAEREAAAVAEQESAAATAAVAERVAEPGAFIGLQDSTGSVSYVRHSAQFQRTTLYAGTTYEHCDTDAQGVWIYRKA